jgi:hypothetical protein
MMKTSNVKDSVHILSGQIVAEQVNRLGNATGECFAGMDLLKKTAEQYVKVSPDITQGRLFEIIESTKFNVDAAKAGDMLRAYTTESLGDPHAAADIVIKDGFNVVKEIQAKSGNSAPSLTRMISDQKYGEMDRLVNADKAERVKELIEKRAQSNSIYADDYRQAAPHVKGELQHGSVSSGGTTHGEALKAASNTDRYVLEQKLTQFASGTFSAMMNGALAGAFVGGGVVVFQQGTQVVMGKQKVGAASVEVAKATVEAASKTAVVSGIAHGIKFIGHNSPILRGNAAVALASSAVKCTELTYQLIKGKITIDQYLKDIGENAVMTLSGIVLGAAGGLLFGPIGAAAAATVAMIGMKQLYQSFLQVGEDARLAREERIQAELFSEMIIAEIKEEEERLVTFYREHAAMMEDLSDLVQLTIRGEENIAETIVQLTSKLGVFVKYSKQEDFDDFMLSEEPLVL